MFSVMWEAMADELTKIAANTAILAKPTAIPAPMRAPSMSRGLPASTDYTAVNTQIPAINSAGAASKGTPPPPVRT